MKPEWGRVVALDEEIRRTQRNIRDAKHRLADYEVRLRRLKIERDEQAIANREIRS